MKYLMYERERFQITDIFPRKIKQPFKKYICFRNCNLVPSDWTRGNGHKTKDRRFPLDIRKRFFAVRVTDH